MADAAAPEKTRENRARRSDEGDIERKPAPLAVREQPRAGVKRGEGERYDPAQDKLNVAGVDGHRIAAEGQQIPERRVDADAVLKPKRKSAESQEDGNIDNAAAKPK